MSNEYVLASKKERLMKFVEKPLYGAIVALMFPIALSTSESLGVNFIPFAVTIMVAASSSFATPIGYQTNLMVYGVGGYHFKDYLYFGIPLTILVGIVTVAIVPLVWHL